MFQFLAVSPLPAHSNLFNSFFLQMSPSCDAQLRLLNSEDQGCSGVERYLILAHQESDGCCFRAPLKSDMQRLNDPKIWLIPISTFVQLSS